MAKHSGKCPKCGKHLEFDSDSGETVVCPGCGTRLTASKAEPASHPVPEPAPAQPDPLIGTMLGEFEIIELLGRGGMGAVYKARQPSLERMVALKVLPRAHSEKGATRFEREARAAAAVQHPNIINIYSVGADRGYQYIAMELVEGETLREVLEREGPLSPERAIEMMKQAASAMVEAHKAGILHRDIKPANILLTPGGRVKVADFGLAKRPDVDVSVTVSGKALGTPLYMPPEVARGGQFEAASDLYSLGATFYHLLAGRPPYEGSSGAEIAVKQVETDVPPLTETTPNVPSALAWAIERLLARDPAERFPTAEALLENLEYIDAGMAASQSDSASDRLMPAAKRRALDKTPKAKKADRPQFLIAGIVAAAILVVGIGIVLIVTLGPKDKPPREKVTLPAPKAAVEPPPGPVVVKPKPKPKPPITPKPKPKPKPKPPTPKPPKPVSQWTTLANGWRVGKAVNLGPVLNSSSYDGDPSVSADGRTMVFSSWRGGGQGKADLWMSSRPSADAPWGQPANPGAPVNTKEREYGPSLSADGLTLVFHSDRAGEQGRFDLWVCTRHGAAQAWGPPVNLGPPVNSATVESCPCLSTDGLTLIFVRGDKRSPDKGDLWMSSRPSTDAPWGQPASLGAPVNTKDHELGPSLSADGLTLVFHSDRPGGQGDYDLWMSTRAATTKPWGEPVNLGASVNSGASDGGGCLSAEGRTLYFYSTRSGGLGDGDIWQAPLLPPGAGQQWTTLSNGWRVGKAVNLGPVVNSSAHDTTPSVSADGRTMVYTSDRGGGQGQGDLWISSRRSAGAPWGKPANPGAPVNTKDHETTPSLSADGLTLVFMSNRAGGQGGHDLWMSTRRSAGTPWGEPVNLGPPVNTPTSEDHPCLSTDGLTLIFTRGDKQGPGKGDLWMSSRPSADAPWGDPVNLGPPINSENVEAGPSLSADGLTLVFHSDRAGGQGDLDLWMSARAGATKPFGEPVNLGALVNSGAPEGAACLSADGRTLYFSSKRPRGGRGKGDIWQAPLLPPGAGQQWTTLSNGWRVGKAVNLGPVVNSSSYERDPSVSADGRTMVFTSDRGGGQGRSDLWMSSRPSADAPWAKPVNPGAPVNTKGNEYRPSLSADGLTLVFGTNRAGGQGGYDLWMSARRNTGEAWGPPVNLGPPVNSPTSESQPCLSSDGLTLIFVRGNQRGQNKEDLWMSSRPGADAPWGEPASLGPPINTKDRDSMPSLSADGLTLVFNTDRAGGQGDLDLWMSTRAGATKPFGQPVNLGPSVNNGGSDGGGCLSAEGRTLYFASERPGGQGGSQDIWQAPLLPPGAPLPTAPPDDDRWTKWQDLFDGKTLKGWKVAMGQAHVADGRILLAGSGSVGTIIVRPGEFPVNDYEVLVECMRVSHADGHFCGIHFPVGASRCSLIAGGGSPQSDMVGLNLLDKKWVTEGPATRRFSFNDSQWYQVRVRVTGAKVEAWIDREKVVDVERSSHEFSIWSMWKGARPFGVGNYRSRSKVRNIRLRRLKSADSKPPLPPPVAAGPWKVHTQWPFDAAEAKRRQAEAAKALGVNVEQTIDLGNGVKLTMGLIAAGESNKCQPQRCITVRPEGPIGPRPSFTPPGFHYWGRPVPGAHAPRLQSDGPLGLSLDS